MAIEMVNYFTKLILRMVTNGLNVDVVAFDKSSAEVVVLDRNGNEIVRLQEQQLRDMLNVCRRARAAAKLADEAASYESREES